MIEMLKQNNRNFSLFSPANGTHLAVSAVIEPTAIGVVAHE